MTKGVLFDVVAIGGALGLWALLCAAVLFATRVRAVTAAPATQDLGGDEPPAVVSLLVDDWHVTEDAVESTVIDLAARDFVEFRQPGNDPRATTVHLLERDASALTPYEAQVLRRLHTLAVGGVVPMTALTFREEGDAQRWDKEFRSALIEDARARGLSRARVSGAGVTLLAGAAAVVGVVVGAVLTRHTLTNDDDPFTGFVVGFVVFAALSALAKRDRGERDTPEGRAAASRWLGLARHLRGDGVFPTLPPASVAVWDRYLSYGTAVGAAHLCSAVLDLGMGSRKLVWSSFGGTWHRVRVRYPRMMPRYGMWGPRLVFGALWPLLLGIAIFRLLDGRPTDTIALLLVLRSVYALVRTAVDLASPVELSGEVLWQARWRSKKPFGYRTDDEPLPWSDYLAMDDGSGPSTTAWALPLKAPLPPVSPGDVVRLTVRRWSRRILTLEVVSPRSASVDLGVLPDVVVTTPAPAPAASGLLLTPGLLVTPDEVGALLGRAVAAPQALQLGPMSLLTYATGGSSPLTVTTARGRIALLTMRARGKASPLAGVGDEAWVGEGFAWSRVGDTIVGVSYRGAGVAPTIAEPLLRAAVARVSAVA